MIRRFFKKAYIKLISFFQRQQAIRRFRRGQMIATRQALQSLLGAPALLHDSEIVALQTYASRATKTIVEIGAAYGGSSVLFLLASKPSVQVCSIDPFITDSMGNFRATRELCYRFVTKALKRSRCAEKILNWQLINNYSYDVIKQWHLPIDLLFIDGDHIYSAVKKDFVGWFPFVEKTGLIIFHDSNRDLGVAPDVYAKGWPGPTQLVEELSQDSRLHQIERVHSLTIFQKN